MNSTGDKQAAICMSIQTKSDEDYAEVINSINSHDGMTALDLSDNELAKDHLRHLVGGRPENVSLFLLCQQNGECIADLSNAMQVPDERLFRLEFPERPGALKDFLDALGYVRYRLYLVDSHISQTELATTSAVNRPTGT